MFLRDRSFLSLYLKIYEFMLVILCVNMVKFNIRAKELVTQKFT